jgi:hypothetical protein
VSLKARDDCAEYNPEKIPSLEGGGDPERANGVVIEKGDEFSFLELEAVSVDGVYVVDDYHKPKGNG